MSQPGNIGSERSAHRRRVAELCRRTARRAGLKGPASVALVLAATEHSDQIRRVSEPALSGASGTPEISAASFESLVAEMTKAILGRRPLNKVLHLAVGILEACDEFDDAVESSALDGASIPTVIGEFFEDGALRIEPCILNTLRRVISPAEDFTKSLPRLARELPALPAAAIGLMQTSDKSSMAELESIVASDPLLAGRLVRAANSAHFSARAEVRYVSQAILRVGIPFARKVLLASCFGRVFASRATAPLWEHSMRVAVHAHELASECGYDRDLAYIAGMVHDIGRLITQRAAAATRLEEEDLLAAGFPLTYAECLIYGTDHAALGSDILKRWKLPPEIAEAVAFHHRPESTKSVLAGLLNLAEDAASAPRSEAPWLGMRRAAAEQLTGIHTVPGHRAEEKSVIWSLAS